MILKTDSSLNDMKNPLEELGYLSYAVPAVDPQVILNFRSTNHQIRAADILGINSATINSAKEQHAVAKPLFNKTQIVSAPP